MPKYRTIYIQVDKDNIPKAYDSVPMACNDLGIAERTVRRHLGKQGYHVNEYGTLYKMEMEQVSSSNRGNIANLR